MSIEDSVNALHNLVGKLADSIVEQGDALTNCLRIATQALEVADTLREAMQDQSRAWQNRMSRDAAMQAALLARIDGGSPKKAYEEVRQRFEAENPAIYDAFQWGQSPDWLTKMKLDSGHG